MWSLLLLLVLIFINPLHIVLKKKNPVSLNCCIFDKNYCKKRASLVAQTVKKTPAMQEIQVWSLGGEDPLEEVMATHSSILAWRIPRTEEPGRLQSIVSQRVRHSWVTNIFTYNTCKKNEWGRIFSQFVLISNFQIVLQVQITSTLNIRLKSKWSLI